jgi:bacillithiol synthase
MPQAQLTPFTAEQRIQALDASAGTYQYSETQQQARVRVLQGAPIVVTGQQVGLFGGPLYTLIKIATAATMAKAINGTAVFWLEDNDHDVLEASQTTLLTGASTLVPWVVPGVAAMAEQKLPVHATRYTDEQQQEILTAFQLVSGEFTAQAHQSLQSAVAGAAGDVVELFISLLWPYVQQWGVLLVRASTVVAMGYHKELLSMDLQQPSPIATTIHATTEAMRLANQAVQAQPTDHVFFVHSEGGSRQRIQPADVPHLAEYALQNFQHFSPNVFGRVLLQDLLLQPTVSVVGAAEFAYQQQLRDAYSVAGIPKPTVVIRPSGTIVDTKTKRHLEKLVVDPEQATIPFEQLQQLIVHRSALNIVPSIDANAAHLEHMFEPYHKAVASIDKTLIATVEAAVATTRNALYTVEKKMRSAIQRQQQTEMERVSAVHSFLYPNNIRQERVFPMIWWQARIGSEMLRIIVEEIARQDANTHHFVSLP